MNSAEAFIKPNYWEVPQLSDVENVENLLGKKPSGDFFVAKRNADGSPVVIENAPFLKDGTPMPTMYWLIDPELVAQVSRIESHGGVKQAEEFVGIETIEKIHKQYELKRESEISQNYDGPKPTGGVGGTRRGVKCLHAHVANYLVNKNDEVGQWTIDQIEKMNNE
ncbi:MAG: DUF501 domain-containing protein [Acidimicrobiia bacterium]